MIRFSNGHEFDFACGSGALAFNGCGYFWEQPLRWLGIINPKAFTVVAKTVSLKPIVGNLSMWHPWTCVRLIKNGTVNAVGFTNPGIQHWISYDYPVAVAKGFKLAASIKAEDPQEALTMAKMLSPLNLAYVEANISCPNWKYDESTINIIVDVLKNLRSSGHPIVLKLSLEQALKPGFVENIQEQVDAFHGINSVPWVQVFGDTASPIEKYPHKLKGGVSGTPILDKALEAVTSLKNRTHKPIIGGGGLYSLDDVVKMEAAGASAFSIGSLFLRRPWRPNRIIKQFRN